MIVVNQFGRRGGRGVRPWLLLPKLLAVAVYFGSGIATLAIWLSTDFTPPLSPAAGVSIRHASLLIRFVSVPALLAAIGFGVALLFQHRREFLRMRWLRVKLALLVVGIPSAHFYLSSRMARVRAGDADVAAQALEFTVGLIVTLLGSAAAIVLARLKPRLGQNYAAAFPAKTAKVYNTTL